MNNEFCKRYIKTCGSNAEHCKGCKFDPNKSKMTYEEFRDILAYWNCNQCKYLGKNCKRLDHEHFCFAKAIFYSYDCGQRNGCICANFKPASYCVWLCNHWNAEFINDYISKINDASLTHLCIDGNFEVRYAVRKIDFVKNEFIDENGNLKWIRKGYSKQSRSSQTGYVYCYEYPDGYVQVGANSPVLWEHCK